MKITATRRLQYAIGHRVLGHEGKCANLHGHNFVFFLTAEAEPPEVTGGHVIDFDPPRCRVCGRWQPSDDEPCLAPPLDPLGRVIDFGVLKAKFDPWFSLHWDHGMVLFEQDEVAIAGLRMIGGKRFFLPYNPTAENLARYVLETVGPQLLEGTGVRLVAVEVHETENGIAKAEL